MESRVEHIRRAQPVSDVCDSEIAHQAIRPVTGKTKGRKDHDSFAESSAGAALIPPPLTAFRYFNQLSTTRTPYSHFFLLWANSKDVAAVHVHVHVHVQYVPTNQT